MTLVVGYQSFYCDIVLVLVVAFDLEVVGMV